MHNKYEKITTYVIWSLRCQDNTFIRSHFGFSSDLEILLIVWIWILNRIQFENICYADLRVSCINVTHGDCWCLMNRFLFAWREVTHKIYSGRVIHFSTNCCSRTMASFSRAPSLCTNLTLNVLSFKFTKRIWYFRWNNVHH